ncbi:MAG TPA: AAA family ATPase [Thermoplasmata archaeon]|nr:AAA family ATPase [Thermoplasmata archaeon]
MAVALTGTPGTGKSSVAARLARAIAVVEVGDLARRHGAARGTGRDVTVDLRRLRRALTRSGGLARVDVVVGHLAHLLPVSAAIVLRCHPVELDRRLRSARRGSAADRHDNVVCEATDAIVQEALARKIPVYEVDTTGRSIAAVTAAVRRRILERGRPSAGTVDWLADPSVTRLLLRPPR